MPAKLLTVILALFLSVPVRGAVEFEYGARPPLSIFDPTGFLEPQMLKEIAAPLTAFKMKEGIDVIVVVLKDIGSAPPEHVAGRFAEAWCESAIHCVVLHVPGRDDSPWILPAGRLVGHLDHEQVQQTVSDARRRAASEPKEPDKVKAAATEATDMLRYWMANAINRSVMIQTESTKMRLDLETKSRRWRVIALVCAASFVPVLLGISYLITLLKKRRPGYFPDQVWQTRLGAPHAGGNHAVADLGPPLP